MKMKKLSEDHYIVVDDKFDPIGSDRKYVHKSGRIWQWDSGMAYVSNNPPQPITHSTQPEFLGTGWMQSVQPLLLSEVKELLGVVDVEKRAEEKIPNLPYKNYVKIGFIGGYNLALEDNKDRKYTLEDIVNAYRLGIEDSDNVRLFGREKVVSDFKKELSKSKTEWEVEIVDGKLKLKQ